jgi:hypothetical protein
LANGAISSAIGGAVGTIFGEWRRKNNGLGDNDRVVETGKC